MIRDAETLNLLLDSVRRFVREQLVPAEKRVDETDEIPSAIVDGMKELGLFGMTIPEEYGGLALTMEEEVRVVFELTQTSPAFRSLLGTTVGIGSQGLVWDGTAEQKQAWLPRMAGGEVIASFCLTEPEAGSDAAPLAGLFTVMARTDPNRPGAGGISAFVVPAGTSGITLGKPDRKMGHGGSHTCDVIFEDCRVPATSLLGGVEGRGFKTATCACSASTKARRRSSSSSSRGR